MDDPVQPAQAHSDLGVARYNANRTAQASAAYETAGRLLSRTGDARAEAELAVRRGYLSWDAGQVEEPLDLFRLAGKLYEQAGCPAGAAQAAAAEAWTMLQLGHRTEAAQRARGVLALPHADPSWPPGLTARITLGLAVAREEPEEAAEQLRRALAPAREDGHLNNQAWCLNCLGVTLRQRGRYEEALASHREAFALLDELFEEHWKIHFLDGYAETHRLAGLPEEALRLHHEALTLARRPGNQYAEARAREGIRELSVC
ncbi:tetratricopeptide repeat protein [Streptomyces sp. NPDC048304]|uniref:tetratricopeptide repeat protein n=1 Tax=Streptomyces sp. NPDC048304 TaxID=3154820 RepID=UPI0033DAE0E8